MRKHKHFGGLLRHHHTPLNPMMNDRDDNGPRERFERDDEPHRHGGRHRGHHGGRHGRFGGGRHGGRLFDYGDLRLLLLAMIAERPRHGYELIKEIEDRLGGSYSPSPGVIYPTLAWLDDMGYATVETAESGRKLYRVTAEGEAFLAANRPAVDALLARIGAADGDRRPSLPPSVLRAMENLKVAMRLRLRSGALDEQAAAKIAAALDAAAQAVEKS